MKYNRQNAITIITLIITIVVMLVLVGVSINIIINSDIIGKSEQAAGAYKNQQNKESNLGVDLIEGYLYNPSETTGYPCTLQNSMGKNLKDYKIYGNSEQDGTPTPTEPIPVYSLGERTRNLFNINTDKDTPMTTISTNITNNITISAVNNSVVTTEPVWRVRVKNSDNTFSYVCDAGYSVGFPRTISASSANPIVEIVYRGTQITSGNYQIQIEEGSTATPYIPYNAIEVKSSGKNIIDFKEALDYWHVPYTYDSNTNIYNLMNIGNGYSHPYIFSDSMDTYTISGIIEDITSENARIGLCYYDGTTITNRTPLFPNETSKTANNVNAFYLDHKKNGYRNISNVQIEKGSTATDYEPYQTPQTTTIDLTGHEPLRKIGDVEDYIDYKNSRIVRNIYKVELDGTEQYERCDQETFAMRLDRELPNGLNNTFSNTNSYCTHANLGSKLYLTWYSSDNNRLEFRQTVSNWGITNYTIEDWVSFLAEQYANGTPVTVYYQLAEPDDTETIELPQIPTVEGTTVLTASDKYLDSSNISANYAM